MFEAIQYVGTPIALVAFIVAVAAYVYRGRLEERRKLIESAPEQERARVMESTLRDFSTVPTDTLTKEQRYQLALQLIEERRSKFRLMTMVSVIVAVLLASVVVVLAVLPKDNAGPLTVRVFGTEAGGAIAAGAITIDAGESSQTRSIDAQGEARFENIPDHAYEDGVRITARVPGFQPRTDTLRALPTGRSHELSLETEPTRVYGTVVDEQRQPLPDIVLNFQAGAAIDTTDAHGNFSVVLPYPPGTQVPVRATRGAVTGLNDQITIPQGAALTLRFNES